MIWARSLLVLPVGHSYYCRSVTLDAFGRPPTADWPDRKSGVGQKTTPIICMGDVEWDTMLYVMEGRDSHVLCERAALLQALGMFIGYFFFGWIRIASNRLNHSSSDWLGYRAGQASALSWDCKGLQSQFLDL